ncbi:polyphenol oxidase I, chloroplastic-like [Sesamum indicum]|uniref:Polyphenol oxidase n=1 Tax=Sesamum indicum TaxID=4182 RepID=I2AWN0_SESIN|nr:polyphenol oxidase I, chloroplastic-like [Sesamum indicum]AFJ42577.1 polyphenol oxidase [Sesamum indicum]
MASLQIPCATPTSQSRSSPHPLFAKPSHFLTHAKRRSNRLRVSATAGQNQSNSSQNVETAQGRVDRRNVLLGLGGGLYGAANLISSPGASANPVQPPELDKCGTATNLNTGEQLDINCCPPVTDRILDYRLPPVYQLKVRPSAHRVSPEYIAKYNKAIDLMKRLPADDPRNFMQQAMIHCAYCNGAYDQPGQGSLDLQIHNSWLFFPFHRWYLYFYERILAKLIGDPTFALPFWNWDNPKGMTIPPMFNDTKAAIYDPKRNQDRLTAVVDLGMTGNTDPLQLVANNLTIMYSEMIRGNADVYDFMGQPYREGTAVNPGPGSSERGSHTAIHVFVGDPREPSGEDLGNFYSAGRDPLFYCHHANVDRMWTLWQYFLPSNKVPDKRITDPDFLNASFVFYDENAQLVRVTVKDSLDNLRMGYDFERVDLPWIDYRPPPQTVKAKIVRTGTTAPKADTLFPLKLEKVVRFQVPKAKKGKADELLVLENITVDTTKFLKFDVFVNDEDDNAFELDKAAYAGTYAQVPHKSKNKTATTSIRLKLTDLYDDMDIGDDDTIVVTLVPRHQGPGVTIGGIKVIENPPAKSSS